MVGCGDVQDMCDMWTIHVDKTCDSGNFSMPRAVDDLYSFFDILTARCLNLLLVLGT